MKNTCKSPKKIICFVLAFFVLMPMTTFARFLGIGEKSGQKEFEKGKVAYEVRDYKNAAASFLVAAEKGNDEALFYIGICYFEGKGVQRDLTKAIQCFRKSAEKGNSDAMFQLGECYSNGYGITKDLDEAVNWYRKSADKGNIKALGQLGYLYQKGIGVKKDEKEAFRLWTKGAEKGDDYSMSRLAFCFFNGVGTERNIDEAVKWSRKATENEPFNIDAQKQVETYTEAKNTRDLANKGDADAMIKLADNYLYGRNGVEKDLNAAVKWYNNALSKGANSEGVVRKISSLTKYKKNLDASNKGDAKAMCELADCYLNGEFDWITLIMDHKNNVNEAIKWYIKAAEKGYAEAQFKLGECRMGENNNEEAFKWFSKAAEQGYAKAQYRLGDCFENGIGTNKDSNKANDWYSKAAEQGNEKAKEKVEFPLLLQSAEDGDVEAQYKLADCYENGNGVDKDKEEALKWYRKAAEQGNSNAQFKLAEWYEIGKGYGINQNRDEAVKWYRKAAESGSIDAQLKLADWFENRKGVAKDMNEAFKWYQKAAEFGNVDAQLKLAEWYENGYRDKDFDNLLYLDMGLTQLFEIKQDKDEALKWYLKAAEQGNEKAKEKVEFPLLLQSAEDGDVEAQYKLAECYRNGKGVKSNAKEALSWYRKCAEQGHAESQYEVYEMYDRIATITGDRWRPSWEEADKWLRKAAEQGLVKAQIELAKNYRLENEMDGAKKWYRKAAEQGNLEAILDLAHLFDQEAAFGLGHQEEGTVNRDKAKARDYEEALKWWRRAAEQGNKNAMGMIGRYYEKGYGIKKDLKEALEWYRKAGDSTGIERIKISKEYRDSMP